MKKYLFLFLCLFLSGCIINNDVSSYSGNHISHLSSEIKFDTSKESITSYEDPIILEKNEKEIKLLIDNEEITYKAKHIIDGITYEAKDNLYLCDEEETNNFIIINGGKLILNQTTIVKKGDAKLQEEDTLRKGKNASILVIGKDSKVQISEVVINVFASYSSAIHCMYNGVAEIKNCDLLVVSKASHAYSTYAKGMIFSESILTLVDSDLVVAFSLYENDGLISILGNNNYIEVHGNPSYVGVIKSGLLILKNIYGYSESSILFKVEEGGEMTLDNANIIET